MGLNVRLQEVHKNVSRCNTPFLSPSKDLRHHSSRCCNFTVRAPVSHVARAGLLEPATLHCTMCKSSPLVTLGRIVGIATSPISRPGGPRRPGRHRGLRLHAQAAAREPHPSLLEVAQPAGLAYRHVAELSRCAQAVGAEHRHWSCLRQSRPWRPCQHQAPHARPTICHAIFSVLASVRITNLSGNFFISRMAFFFFFGQRNEDAPQRCSREGRKMKRQAKEMATSTVRWAPGTCRDWLDDRRTPTVRICGWLLEQSGRSTRGGQKKRLVRSHHTTRCTMTVCNTIIGASNWSVRPSKGLKRKKGAAAGGSRARQGAPSSKCDAGRTLPENAASLDVVTSNLTMTCPFCVCGRQT